MDTYCLPQYLHNHLQWAPLPLVSPPVQNIHMKCQLLINNITKAIMRHAHLSTIARALFCLRKLSTSFFHDPKEISTSLPKSRGLLFCKMRDLTLEEILSSTLRRITCNRHSSRKWGIDCQSKRSRLALQLVMILLLFAFLVADNRLVRTAIWR